LHDTLPYRLFNFAAAGVATLLLYGTAAAIAFREPQLPAEPVAPPAKSVPRIAAGAAALPAVVPPFPMQPSLVLSGRIGKPSPSVFQLEQKMSYAQLMKRWNPFIAKAAKRFSVPAAWIRQVMQIESGGRTMMAENAHIVSSQGALGLMQVQRGTYAEMRAQYGLGPDPFDPHDNILAGAAYLRWLRGKYGYPVMFEAYNDGPGHLDHRLTSGALVPAETRNYVKVITLALGDKAQPDNGNAVAGANTGASANTRIDLRGIGTSGLHQVALGSWCGFTRPDGTPLVIDCTQVSSVRAPLLEENAPDVKSVLTIGAVNQSVRESEETARQIVLARGGRV
jgi:hypothetical protein